VNRSLAWVVLATLAAPGFSAAADHPIAGARLVVKRSGSTTTFRFVSRDPALLLPQPGSADDPVAVGATVDVFSAVEGSATLAMPPGLGTPGWRVAHSEYSYMNSGAPAAPSPVHTATLKQGRVARILARALGLPLTTGLGPVGIRITTGAERSCALFPASTIRRDVPGRFLAERSSTVGLTDCSNGALGGAMTTTTLATTSTTTTTTSTTTSTLFQCGNGIVEPGEQCDDGGTAFPTSQCLGFFCGLPGFSNGCQCCTNASPGGCCDPSAYYDMHRAQCLSTRCDPPFECPTGGCEPDHTCCSPNGGECLTWEPLYYPDTVVGWPCCSGEECRGEVDGINRFCCTRDAGTCTSDGECCTGHCASGACAACFEDGASCTTSAECCTSKCVGGICACKTHGESCWPNTGQCCGGGCDALAGCFDTCQTTGSACSNEIVPPCCSGSCTGGVCDCSPAGAPCARDSSRCCSGSCNTATGICNP
jgi:hypothetical protein